MKWMIETVKVFLFGRKAKGQKICAPKFTTTYAVDEDISFNAWVRHIHGKVN